MGSMVESQLPPLQITIKNRPTVRVAYLCYQGPFGAALGRFWAEEVYPWIVENGLFGAPRYGISHNDPQVTACNLCRYDAGVEVSKDYAPSQNVQIMTLAGGLYACTKFKGTSKEVPAAWDRILREWLPASRYQLAAQPSFEYYPVDGEYDEKTGVFACEFCLPISKI